MPKTDKLIVTNVAALRGKYGAGGVAAIRRAVARLIRSDGRRGLVTRLLDVGSGAAMAAIGAPEVTNALNVRQNKAAIDGAYRHFVPDYLLILGSLDVVPHQDLINPLYSPDPDDDNDRHAFGDLPYACEAPYSRRIEDFRGPTRVVGRLPDVTGAQDPRFLLGVLRTAARYQTRPREDYQGYFGLSARVWRGSTALSLRMLAGSSDDLKLSPREGPAWSNAELRPLLHFINCHGARMAPRFFGQRTSDSDDFPDAHLARNVEGRITEGTVAAAECCYGAELYDPPGADGQRGICYAYLASGAYGFLGSSTIAYGPSTSNGWADLLCRYFLEEVLRGASLGRALLEARQRYALGMTVLHAEDLKTLAQFSLLGDPSIHPISRVPQALEQTRLFKRALAQSGSLPPGRGLRRDRLMRTGVLVDETVGAVRPKAGVRIPGTVRQVLVAAARDSGLPPGRMRRISFTVHDPAGRRIDRQTGIRRGRPTAVHGMVGSFPSGPHGMRRIVLISATVENGRIVRLRRLHSR
jgi:hypothetical protein